ncbi:hypothetical protein B5S28_g2028 [[Candida] boidinii]|uniref:Unnamed protein product n=1 Tax=Candida boidinii TaxID=5477 RepID=A0ACB5TGX1_CANBO|nr:hypothetical protein B5S28_g2028 [[Candida] boidinii]OWB60053.1 hypothetical protein B5S29_g920 [[Candida] boidinii]OWB71903.1 hypothetical protein B5S31_g1600 [[Candida] boidinii]OWB77049.1 hypothetical protein B5S32_g1208 [[Candida] boidinii]GME87420.1 unnamed protein product [[Candida] boidinii]
MSVASSSSWTSFIKSIASYNGDLSSLTAPPFILSPTSLVEYSQYWAEHVDLLLAPNFITDETSNLKNNKSDPIELKRMLAVTKWFISTLRSQYCSRNESLGSEKKPLNPFLGELFVGKWSDDSNDKVLGDTVLLSEQVSHHPPITAYAVENEKNNTLLEGYNGIRASMSTTSLNVKQYGHGILTYGNLNNETYLITLPPLHIEGIIVASPFVELEQKSIIQSSSGYIAIIEYSGRGYFSGKKNTFKARIYEDKDSSSHKSKALYTIMGQWSGNSYILPGYSQPSSKDELFFDSMNAIPQHLSVKPIENQHPLETRKAWLSVSEAIKKGDYDLIHQEKSKLENDQRDLRKSENESGSTWERRWFHLIDLNDSEHTDKNDPLIDLAKSAGLSTKNVASGTSEGSSSIKNDAESKHWRFSPEKFQKETEIKIL